MSTAAGGSRRPGAMMRGKLKAPKRLGLEVSPDEMWERLAHAIQQIQNHNVSTLSYEEHYRYAYNLVLFHQGQMLYDGVKRKVKEHLETQCKDLLQPAFLPGGVQQFTSDIVLPATSLPSLSSQSSSSKGKQRQVTTDTQTEQSQPVAAPSAMDIDAPTNNTDAAARSQQAERLLKAIKSVWDDHCACMAKLRDVLKYVDRVFVPQNTANNVLPVWDLGLELFRDHVLHSRKYPIAQHLYYALLSQIQSERKGQVINRSAVKANIDMLNSLSYPRANTLSNNPNNPTIYKHVFEPALLQTSSRFYAAESQRLLETTDAKTYLRHVEHRFIEEEGRATVLLNPTTDGALRTTLETHLLLPHLNTILDMQGSGLSHMLQHDLKDDLHRLYLLFWRINPEGPIQLKAALKAFIAKHGKEINDDGQNNNKSATGDAPQGSSPQATLALKWVEDVLSFKKKFDDILETSFLGDKSIDTVLNEAFETFINTNPRAPEFISLFIDENLKKGLKGKTEEEVEETLDRTIVVFRFLHEKDIFERYYKTHLAKRLLQNRSVSDDAERGMMAKLKIECGHGYVQKLQGMLNDMKVSEDTASAFTDSLTKTSREMPFDLNVSVLTSTYWPIPAQVQPCTMPSNMVSARQAFENFYQNRHSGRVLNWHPNLGTADVRVTFKSRKHELNVSTYALVVLMMFDNEDGPVSYETLKSSTSIPEGDLQRTLQSLACAKYKILLKDPKGRDVGPTDTFTFNSAFTCPLARIKIAQIAGSSSTSSSSTSRLESSKERSETLEKISRQRDIEIEASIVRIMKSYKTCTHNDLINEVIKQLMNRFSPIPETIKKRIESLIDREYLERDEGNRGVYNYLA